MTRRAVRIVVASRFVLGAAYIMGIPFPPADVCNFVRHPATDERPLGQPGGTHLDCERQHVSARWNAGGMVGLPQGYGATMDDQHAFTVSGSRSPDSDKAIENLVSAMVAVGCFKDFRGQPVDDGSPSY
jgi:hypothetical protein